MHEHSLWQWMRILGHWNRWAESLGHKEITVLVITDEYVYRGNPCLIRYSEVVLRAGLWRHSVKIEKSLCSVLPLWYPHSHLKQGTAIFKSRSGEKTIIFKIVFTFFQINNFNMLVYIKCLHHFLLKQIKPNKPQNNPNTTWNLISRSKFLTFKIDGILQFRHQKVSIQHI